MGNVTLTEFVFFEKSNTGQYSIKDPKIAFPKKCMTCGKPQEAAREVILHIAPPVVESSSYIPPKTIYVHAIASLHFSIPLCKEHRTQYDVFEKHMKRDSTQTILSVLIAAILGSLVMALVLFVGFHTDTVFGGIFLSILFGAPGGLLIFWPMFYYFPAFRRLLRKEKPYHFKNPHYDPMVNTYRDPCVIQKKQENNNIVSMRVTFQIENDQMRSEFEKLNGVDDHLLAAMNHTDFTTSANAIEALSLARCESAVPIIINKFIDSIHVSDLVCNAAVNALKSLGIPKPCDATTVKRLISEITAKQSGVITILGLSSIDHLLAALDNGDAGVRSAVIYALGETKNVKAVPALIERLSDTE